MEEQASGFETDLSVLETLTRDYWVSKKKGDKEYILIYEDIVRLIHSMSFKYRMKIRITKGEGGEILC